MGISQEIIDKPPRAGLWNNQTDEAELGMSYDLIDQILYEYCENDKEISEISQNLEISQDDVDMIIKKIIRNEHKSKVPESPQKTIL